MYWRACIHQYRFISIIVSAICIFGDLVRILNGYCIALLTMHMSLIPLGIGKSMYVCNGLCKCLHVCMCVCVCVCFGQSRVGWRKMRGTWYMNMLPFYFLKGRIYTFISVYNCECRLEFINSKTLIYDLRIIKRFTIFICLLGNHNCREWPL